MGLSGTDATDPAHVGYNKVPGIAVAGHTTAIRELLCTFSPVMNDAQVEDKSPKPS